MTYYEYNDHVMAFWMRQVELTLLASLLVWC